MQDLKCVLFCESHGLHTFFLHLALNIWVINDFTQGNTAELWTQETFSPAAAVGAVEDGHAEVTGEVGPLSKHRVLHTTCRKETRSTEYLSFPLHPLVISSILYQIIQVYKRWSSDDCTNLVEVTVQPAVNDGVKVLQAAPVECIEDFSAFPRLLKPGVHLITVLQLKQEVGHRGRNPLIFRQVTKFGILEEIE